ncbi:MAG TPA: hypothetical protein VGJ44_09460, partial [Kribbellaceae bacterium]
MRTTDRPSAVVTRSTDPVTPLCVLWRSGTASVTAKDTSARRAQRGRVDAELLADGGLDLAAHRLAE